MTARQIAALLTAATALLALRAVLAPHGRAQAVGDGSDAPSPDASGLSSGLAGRSSAILVVFAATALFGLGLVFSIYVGAFGFLADVDDGPPGRAAHLRVVGGDAERGRAAILAYECRVCHAVPGLPELAPRSVGPPLAGISARTYIGGVLPNRPSNLVAWIVDPPRHAPETAMPDMDIDEQTATDIAAYLYAH